MAIDGRYVVLFPMVSFFFFCMSRCLADLSKGRLYRIHNFLCVIIYFDSVLY